MNISVWSPKVAILFWPKRQTNNIMWIESCEWQKWQGRENLLQVNVNSRPLKMGLHWKKWIKGPTGCVVPQFEQYTHNSTLLIQNLGGYCKSVDGSTQKKIMGSIFPEKIYFENKSYRTTKMNEAFTLIFPAGKALNENSRPHDGRLSGLALRPAQISIGVDEAFWN